LFSPENIMLKDTFLVMQLSIFLVFEFVFFVACLEAIWPGTTKLLCKVLQMLLRQGFIKNSLLLHFV